MTITFLAQHNGSTAYEDDGAGGSGTASDGSTGTGALRYADGHTSGVQAAVIERSGTNLLGLGSFEGTFWWNGAGSPAPSYSTDTNEFFHGTQSRLIEAAGSDPGGLWISVTAYRPAAAQGETFSVLGMFKADVAYIGQTARVECREYTGTSLNVDYVSGPSVTLTGEWQPVWGTFTVQDAATDNLAFRWVAVQAEFWLDSCQIEMAGEPTTYIGGDEGSGYSTTGTDELKHNMRENTVVAYPLASAPDWVAARISEDFGATWQVAYDSAGTIGSHGTVTHDGANLLLGSTGSTLFGPVMAGTGTLTETNKTILENDETWTFGMSLEPPAPPVVNAGPDAFASQNIPWTQAGSFTDADSTSWTATVDYDDGDGDQSLTLTGKTFSLSHTYTTTGTYTVTVNVTDDGSLTGSDTVSVTVSEGPTLGAFVVLSVPGTDASAPVITLGGGD